MYVQAKYDFEEGVNPVTIAVHPSGDDLVCSTSTGDCKSVFVFHFRFIMHLTC